MVARVEAASGKELAKIETGRPLGTGPVLLGNDLLLCGNDGTLHVVEAAGAKIGERKTECSSQASDESR